MQVSKLKSFFFIYLIYKHRFITKYEALISRIWIRITILKNSVFEKYGNKCEGPKIKIWADPEHCLCCCCLPCNHCSNWTWVVEEILAFYKTSYQNKNFCRGYFQFSTWSNQFVGLVGRIRGADQVAHLQKNRLNNVEQKQKRFVCTVYSHISQRKWR